MQSISVVINLRFCRFHFFHYFLLKMTNAILSRASNPLKCDFVRNGTGSKILRPLTYVEHKKVPISSVTFPDYNRHHIVTTRCCFSAFSYSYEI